ncbi:folylpolyglutamate synthase, mitochondrial-like isoform X1 [Megalops cyprinoides]|uniref:folylpolyglutamate synthase, mitochondrial-like isoform X1 n=1 Tax=Megalops cyprinoides TaxID=118141 RepID=UPI0018652FB8|nr:folylpolyglutamate synthase, mitochondrial-like isoform X1 [Megalops cyprinoides]
MLNSLQHGGGVTDRLQWQSSHPELQLHDMRTFLQRAGLTLDELDHLNAIHVAGTKGKGSTCAFTEKILRNYGFRTGFFSSPHLVQVRERIRINGEPISKELFTKYFWQVHEQLDATKDSHGGAMPSYFIFLTVLAFHVFLQEKVDLAVIEVGIGGAYDCTNVIRRPWVCGVSSLGIDHTNLLGDTIEEIAWQKAGIFKPGVPAFTVKQPRGSIAVLQDRAKEMECPLFVCPDLEMYRVPPGSLRLGLEGQHQHSNASLALQLSFSWLQQRHLRGIHVSVRLPTAETTTLCQAPAFQLSPLMVKGLEDTRWPGRTQMLRHGPVTYFLDGAHTTHSMIACVRWFSKATTQQETPAEVSVVRVLLFNATGERDCAALLRPLVSCHFDFAVFCPNVAETAALSSADQHNSSMTVEKMLTRCLDNQRSWQTLSEGEETLGAKFCKVGRLPLVAEPRNNTLVFPSILSALQWISQGRDPVLASLGKPIIPVHPSITSKAQPLREAAGIHVLITGSLHLVGGVLKHLDPSLAR